MFKNYILIAWRSLVKHRLFSFINIFGLALSMSVCMIVLIRIIDAFEYDNFHHDQKNIYRVISSINKVNGNHWTFASSPLPLKAALISSGLPITITHLYPAINTVAEDASRSFHVNGAFIEPEFFDLFGFTLKSGIKESLSKPGKLLLSQAMAEKFYGVNNPLGKSLALGILGEFEITGVINQPPSKSHINYDIYVSMASVPSLEQSGLLPDQLNSWGSFEQGYTYLKLDNEVSRQSVEDRLSVIENEITAKAKQSSNPDQQATFDLKLQPISSITPVGPDIYNEIGRGPSRGSLLAETGIVMIILLAACFNYTNLSVARAMTRSKEVGIRKLSGAQRWQIFAQYITEAVLLAFLALMLANVILGPILEYKPFNDGYEMVPSISINLKLMIVFSFFAVFAGLMAGTLPAWILSSFQPARILRGISSEKLIGNLSFRKVLMVFQFSLSLVILLFLSIFYQQFNFMARADLGYNYKDVILIPAGNNAAVTENELSKLSNVMLTGITSGSIGSGDHVSASRQSMDPQAFSMERYRCNSSWLNMLKLEILAGTNQLKNESSVIINRKASLAFGFDEPLEAIGSMIYIRDSIPVTIGGVVDDIYSQGYGNPVQPMLFEPANEAAFIAVQSQTIQPEFITTIESEWKRQNPLHTFDYVALGKEMADRNDQSAQVSLLGYLGFMTLTIATLGLLGLVVYSVETRRKEISVRKIIGASVQQLITLLSRSYIRLLLIAGLIALPIGYVLDKFFLMNFVNRIEIGLIDLLLCVALLLSIGLITILSQTWKASLENPSRNLRSE